MFAGMPDFNQSLEMMKTMWGNVGTNPDGSPMTGGFNMPGVGASNPFGMPTMDVEELDKRIQELKNVENWLNLNLNVLKTTIQGLEVQRATLGALQAFSESIKTAGTESTKKTAPEKKSTEADPVASASGMAVDMMNSMAQSMTQAMSAMSEGAKSTSTEAEAKPARKNAKSRPSKARASTARRATGN
jgi:hypothetical protein